MFSFFFAHGLQINPLLPFFNTFSGTHVRPCVQVATPLENNAHKRTLQAHGDGNNYKRLTVIEKKRFSYMYQ